MVGERLWSWFGLWFCKVIMCHSLRLIQGQTTITILPLT